MTRSPSGEVLIAESGEGEGDDFVPLPLATDLPAGTQVGEYTIDCKLGDGGMATVYGATHPLIGKKAAIKVMNPALSLDLGLVERFVLEAQAVNHIRHPNIVDVFSFGQLPDGRSYFVMEWLPGETLYARMWERKLTLDEALDIMDQVCDALEAAHEAGIVHRDLKPANVFLTPRRGRREQVKLLDFGVAKLTLKTDQSAQSLALMGPQTQSGQVVGTPEYIAPEQARAKTVDGKCDVYALGVIAFEMILGQRPFVADNSADLVRMHLSETPPVPKSLWPEIPLPLADLMLRMLEKKAGDRPTPRQVRSVIHELRGTPPPFDFGDGEREPSFEPLPSFGMLPSLPGPVAPMRKRGSRAALFAGVGAVALLAGAGLWWRLGRAPRKAEPAMTAPSQPQPPAPAPTPIPSPAKPGTVVVRVDAPDARIELDGELVAQAASGARVAAAPGGHLLSVTAPGRKPYASRVTVAEAGVVEVAVHLHSGGDHHAHTTTAPPTTKPVKPQPQQQQNPTAPKRHDPDYLVDPFSSGK